MQRLRSKLNSQILALMWSLWLPREQRDPPMVPGLIHTMVVNTPSRTLPPLQWVSATWQAMESILTWLSLLSLTPRMEVAVFSLAQRVRSLLCWTTQQTIATVMICIAKTGYAMSTMICLCCSTLKRFQRAQVRNQKQIATQSESRCRSDRCTTKTPGLLIVLV